MSRAAAPAEIAALTAGLDIDAADVIAHCSASTAAECLKQGWPRGDEVYDIGVYYGDREIAESLLSRSLTRDETRVLEGCIRYYLRTGAVS